MIRTTPKAPRKKRSQWNSGYRLVSVSYPKNIDSPTITKRYSVEIKYKDEKGKIRSKTVLFGNRISK